jgi:hypothetical protein
MKLNLNDYLFEQIERLNDHDLKGEDLSAEVIRGKAMCDVAAQIVSMRRLTLDALKSADELPGVQKHIHKLLE